MASVSSMIQRKFVTPLTAACLSNSERSFMTCTFYFFCVLVAFSCFVVVVMLSATRASVEVLNKLPITECTIVNRLKVIDDTKNNIAHWNLQVVFSGSFNPLGKDILYNGTIAVCYNNNMYFDENCITFYPINNTLICLYEAPEEDVVDIIDSSAIIKAKNVYSWIELEKEGAFYTSHALSLFFGIPVYVLGVCAILIAIISLTKRLRLYFESKNFNTRLYAAKAAQTKKPYNVLDGNQELEGLLLVPSKYRHIVVRESQLHNLRKDEEEYELPSLPSRILFVQKSDRAFMTHCNECMLYTAIVFWSLVACLVLYITQGSQVNFLVLATLLLPFFGFIPCCYLTREQSYLVIMTDKLIHLTDEWTDVKAVTISRGILEDPLMQRGCHLELNNDGSGTISWELRNSYKLYRFGPVRRLKTFHKRLVSKIEEASGLLPSNSSGNEDTEDTEEIIDEDVQGDTNHISINS